MRIALVNLPHGTPVVRRYMCSYNSPIFLFPPLELMSAGTVLRDQGGHEVMVWDAIASQATTDELAQSLAAWRPQLIVSLMGFEIFEQDVDAVRQLRSALGAIPWALFGHYPSVFPAEVLRLTGADWIVHGEPEITLLELCQAGGLGDPSAIAGLSYRNGEGVAHSRPRPWLKEFEQLPPPDYDLVGLAPYSEFLLPRPFVVVQSARGCPFGCNFCVRSYGQRLALRPAAQILDEIAGLVRRRGVRSVRFIDDTFFTAKARVLEICRGFRERLPDVVWSCLSRADTLDDRVIAEIGASGCRRVYIGIESGSQRILERYNKGYDVASLPGTVEALRRARIEVGAFFMVGHPEETEDDFAQTLRLARTLKLDYATIGKTIPYPGTPLYDEYRDQVDFSLYPYRNDWRDPGRRRQLDDWERRFYRALYLNPHYLLRNAHHAWQSPATVWRAGRALLPFLRRPSERAELVRSELI